MNYRQIEIFVAVLESGSVTAAADRLGLSQPAVSKSLKLLETEIGVQLFLRNPRGLYATDEARALYLEAGRVTASFGHLSDFARALTRMQHARLQVSCLPALALHWLPSHVAGFVGAYPEATFAFRTSGSPEIVQAVAQGEVDVGISQARVEEIMVEKAPLIDLRAVCVLARAHPFAQRSVICLSDLCSERIIVLGRSDELRKAFDAALQARGLAHEARLEVGLGAMICQLVAEGIGIGVIDHVSGMLHDAKRTVIRPLDIDLRVPIWLIQNSSKPQSFVQRSFVDHLLARVARERPQPK